VVDFEFKTIDYIFVLDIDWDEGFDNLVTKKDIIDCWNFMLNEYVEYIPLLKKTLKEIEVSDKKKWKEIAYTTEWSSSLGFNERLTVDEIKEIIEYLAQVIKIIIELGLSKRLSNSTASEFALVSFGSTTYEWKDIYEKIKTK